VAGLPALSRTEPIDHWLPSGQWTFPPFSTPHTRISVCVQAEAMRGAAPTPPHFQSVWRAFGTLLNRNHLVSHFHQVPPARLVLHLMSVSPGYFVSTDSVVRGFRPARCFINSYCTLYFELRGLICYRFILNRFSVRLSVATRRFWIFV
jgi:hypothetical protein